MRLPRLRPSERIITVPLRINVAASTRMANGTRASSTRNTIENPGIHAASRLLRAVRAK